MTEFQPIQFARLPARRRALRIAELFSQGTDEPSTDEQTAPARKIANLRPCPAQAQPRRSTAM